MSGIMDCYHNLANAIVLQAVEDYSELLKIKSRFNTTLNDREIKKLEDWFHSDQYTLLTDLDPDTLISKLKARYLK